MILQRLTAALAAFSLFAAPLAAFATPDKAPVVFDAGGRPIQSTPTYAIDANGNYVAPGGSSSANPFKVLGNATLAMTTSSGRVALPTADTSVFIYNAGAATAFVKLGNGSVTAAATDQAVPAGSAIALSNAAGNLDIAAILASGTGTLYISTGTGTPSGFGGGSGAAAPAVTFGAGAVDSATQRVVHATDDPLVTGQTNQQANAGADAAKAVAVQGVTGGKAVPISAASLPLPTGAAADASVTNPQANAGSDATKAVSIQGISSGKAVPISAAALPLPAGAATAANQLAPVAQGSTTSGQSGALVLGAVSTAAPSDTTAQSNALSLDVHGATRTLAMDSTGAPVDFTADVKVVNGSTAFVVTANAVQNPVTTASYSATFVGLAPATSPTDLFTIIGSGVLIVRVTSLQFTCTATAAADVDVLLYKRNTVDTAGTTVTAPALVRMDSAAAAPGAAVAAYSANPTISGTIGAGFGLFASRKLGVPTSASAGFAADGTPFSNNLLDSPMVLRTTTEQLALNLNSATMTGGSCDLTVRWTESTT